MEASAISNFEKLLPFLYYMTDRHQNWEFDLEYIDYVRNV